MIKEKNERRRRHTPACRADGSYNCCLGVAPKRILHIRRI
jgi:hypothetical protein